jgi:hypothetical protein
MCWFGKTHYTAKRRPLLKLSDHEISLFIPSLHITDGGVQRNATNSLQPCLLRHFLTIRVDIMQLEGLMELRSVSDRRSHARSVVVGVVLR